MAWLIFAAAALAYTAFWVALGRVLPPLARRIGPRRGPGLNPHIPHPHLNSIVTAPGPVVHPCGCMPCPTHAAAQIARARAHMARQAADPWAAEWEERLHRP